MKRFSGSQSTMTRFPFSQWIRRNWLISFSGIATLLAATPVFAHHAMGGRLPANFFEGFLSGLAHPIIGFDHFAFIVAVGFLAASKRQGVLIPIAFVLTAMAGTGLHLLGLSLPAVEIFVASSILLFGILLATPERLSSAVIIGLAAVSGLFHGYAYGESILGAEMTPMLAYLVGFTVIQLVISGAAFWIAKRLLRRSHQSMEVSVEQLVAPFRSIGLVICGIGIAFLSSQIVNAIFPV